MNAPTSTGEIRSRDSFPILFPELYYLWFRQTAVRDPTLRWDTIKEDIYVWAITQRQNTSTFQFQSNTSTFHDRLPISACLGPPAAESGKATPPHATYTAEGKESASGTLQDAGQGGRNASSHTSAGSQAARVSTLAKCVPNVLELQRALTPLRHSQFERELVNHPDKAWTHWLLSSIKNGVALGYDGPHGSSEAHNLKSSLEHTQVIDEELRKECLASRILGPFSSRPIKNLKCSGLGAVPKKSWKWRMILHLSAPLGKSINDHISKENFSLHYASVDDAIHMLSALGKGALMAKVDLKSAFRMVPVWRQDYEVLGMKWKEAYYIDTCLPFGLRSVPYLFNQFAEALQWILQHIHMLSALWATVAYPLFG